MRVTITARHAKASEDLKAFAEKAIRKLERFYDRIVDVEMILDYEQKDQVAECRVTVYGTLLRASARSPEIRQSIDAVLVKITHQLKRYKERQRAHPHVKGGGAALEEMRDESIE